MNTDGKPEDAILFPLLAETGYATHYNRLHEHETHTKSNYLMNLAEAICAFFQT